MHTMADAPTKRWVVRTGSAVEARDGHVGTVAHVVVIPRRRAVTHLVVRAGGLLHRDVVVDAGTIESADEAAVRLRLTVAQVRSQPPFRPGEYVGPHPVYVPPDAYSVAETLLSLPHAPAAGWWQPDDLPEIEGDTRVESRDGYLGQATRFLLDPATRQVRGVVVHIQAGLRAREIIVPVDWITEADSDTLFVEAGREQLDRLPVYRGDDAVRRDVAAALAHDEVLRIRPASVWRVAVQDGVVALGGYVHRSPEGERAFDAVRGVPGVLGVRDELIADDDLEDRVAQALAGHASTRDLHVEVAAFLGVVTLSGTVPSLDARRAVEEVAAATRGVRGVVNAVEAPDAPGAPPPVVLPAIGTPVYAADGRVGYVAQVILDPGPRRVAGLVVADDPEWEGQSEDEREDARAAQAARSIVVPLDAVHDLTGAVLLRLDRAAVARLPRFREADFARPAARWRVPFNYEREDVRLVRRHPEAA